MRPEPWVAPVSTREGALAPGERISGDVACFHDAPSPDLTITATGEPSAPGLEIVQRHAGGSYLSLACDLPFGALALMRKGRLFEVAVRLTASPARTAYLRLNLRRPPNLFQTVVALDLTSGNPRAAFDLSGPQGGISATEGWVELIFESSSGCRITVSDLLFWMSPRAEI